MILVNILLIYFGLSNAHAYISSKTTSGKELHWSRSTQVTFRSNERNSSILSPNTVFNILTTSLARWRQTSFNGFDFKYYQGSDPNYFPVETGQGSENVIFFSSASSNPNNLSCGIIALTEVWYESSSGGITRSDLRFNDKCFNFTENPKDTANGTSNNIYLSDVATHEFGHVLGLDHSEHIHSSMMFMASPEMHLPSCDEHAAMTHHFGTSTTLSKTGSVIGKISAPNGNSIFGAHIELINATRGSVVASTLSDKDGSFLIDGIEAGQYYILTEPYYPGSGSLGAYYQSVNSLVCNGSQFLRSFVTNGGTLKNIQVLAGQINSIGNITASCSTMVSPFQNSENNFNTAPVLATQTINDSLATYGVFDLNKTQNFYKLEKQSGSFQISGLGFSLFSPIDLLIEVLDQNQNPLAVEFVDTVDNVYASTASNFINYDSKAKLRLSSESNFWIKVKKQANISSMRFPAGGIAVDNKQFYLLNIKKELTNDPAPLYPSNTRCSNFSPMNSYPNQGTPSPVNSKPPSNDGSQNEDDDTSGCGLIKNHNHQTPPKSNNTALINFALIAIMLFMIRQKMMTRKRQ